jgi:hypothetical protein
MWLYFMIIWNMFRSFLIIYGRLVYFAVILHIFPVLVCLVQEKSGNPGLCIEREIKALATKNMCFLNLDKFGLIFFHWNFGGCASKARAHVFCCVRTYIE